MFQQVPAILRAVEQTFTTPGRDPALAQAAQDTAYTLLPPQLWQWGYEFQTIQQSHNYLSTRILKIADKTRRNSVVFFPQPSSLIYMQNTVNKPTLCKIIAHIKFKVWGLCRSCVHTFPPVYLS